MEMILFASNGTILALLYQKLLENEKILIELRGRVSALEGAIIERRKSIRPPWQDEDSRVK